MNIVIKSQNPFEASVKANSLLWRLYSREFKIYIGTLIAAAIVFLIIGILCKHTFWVSSQTHKEGIYYNLNLSFSVALALLLLAIIYYRHMLKSKSAFFQLADKYAADYPLTPIEKAIEIDDDVVKVSGINSKHEYKWKFFSHFKLAEGFLFLMSDNSYLNVVAIPYEQLSESDKHELLGFLGKKLIAKR